MSKNQQQILNRLNKDAHQEQSIYWYRSAVVYLVDNFLSDLQNAEKSLSTVGQSSECFNSLLLCEFFIGKNVDIYLHLTSNQGAKATPTLAEIKGPEPTAEEKCSIAFCTWFIQRLLRLLASPGCSSLHQTCIKVLTCILHSYKTRSDHSFFSLTSQLVHSSADLIAISEKLYSSDNTGSVHLSRFDADLESLKQSLRDPAKCSPELHDFDDNSLTNAHISFTDPGSCELLQINLMKLLLTVHCFDSVCKSLLFTTACCQLELGGLELKMVSVEVLVKLLKQSGLQNLIDAQEYFFQCVAGLLGLLLSGCGGADKESVVMLEENMVSLLNVLVTMDISHSCGHHITTADLQGLLTSITSHLVTHGFYRVITEGLRTSIAGILGHILKTLPPMILTSIYSHILEPLFQVFLGLLGGQMADLQFAVPVLVQLVMLERRSRDRELVSHCISTPTAVTPTQLSRSQQTMSRLKRKRRFEQYKGEVKKKSSLMFQRFLEKTLEIISTEKNRGGILAVIVASSLVTEVGTSCLLLTSKIIEGNWQADVEEFFSADLLQKLFSCWQTCLLSGKINCLESSKQNMVLQHIITSIGTIFACHGLIPLEADLLHGMIWMISLPWLLNDPTWEDLRPSNVQEISHLSQMIADNLNVSTISQCLKALALAPKEATPTWRVHIMRHALECTKEEVRHTAVVVFPMLMFKLGPNYLHLIADLLHPLLKDLSMTVQDGLAKEVGELSCVAAQTVVLERKGLTEGRVSVGNLTSLRCTICSNAQGAQIQSKPLDPKLFSPFLSLIKSSDVRVRKCIVKCLMNIFCHIPVRSQNPLIVNMLTTCLQVIYDEDFDVRIHFSKVIPQLVEQDKEASLSDTDRMIVECLKEACVKACTTPNYQLHETIILTLGQVARVAEGELLLITLIILLENRLSYTAQIAAAALQEIQGIPLYKQISPQQLFRMFKPAICKFLVEAMLEAQSSSSQSNAEKILHTVSSSLGFSDIKMFLQGCEKYFLPLLVSKASADASGLIRLLTTMQAMPNRRQLIINNIKYIFSYLVRMCQKQELERALDFLQKETDFELGSLLRLDFQRVHNELLLYLSTNYTQVFSGLQMLSMNDELYTGPKTIKTPEQMAAYLEPRLLGFLAFFDSQLVNTNIALAEKKLALESLISIVMLMGSKHICSIRHKVVNTLRLSLQFKDRSLMEISCRAWNCFVRSLELPLLGQMLSQIVATLLPLLLQMPKQVAEIISYMVVENRSVLQSHFHEIYFLPDLPELADANAVLRHYMEDPSCQVSLHQQLIHCIKGASHESLDIRTHALSKLHRLLQEKRESLYDLILGSETADPIVTQLASVLLEGCRESDSKTQCLYGQCLGELGALDPGRLKLLINNPLEHHAKFQASVEDDNFAVGLINEVIKTFLAATEPRVQDCSAFALQELLQIYKISDRVEGERSSLGARLWQRFPELYQEILIPLLTSKYKLTADKDWSSLPKPIYGSEKGNNYRDWVSNWTSYLVSKVKAEKAYQVFQACSAAKRHNLQVALYLLPHVVVQVLLESNEQDHLEIYNEVMEVVTQAKKADARQSSTSDQWYLSAQTVFSVLDYLTRWRTHRILLLTTGISSSKVPAYTGDVPFMTINRFISRIPQDTLAQASFNCKAYTRALMQFEQFIANTKQNLQEHLDFVQRLYDCLNEPDGVVGVAFIRQSQPTLMQEILAHESLGQQQDAQACYERALQVFPTELWPHQGLVQSLMELGQLNKALLHTTGVLTDNPHWMSQLNHLRVEAAWKMSNWDCLENMMKKEKSTHNTWSVCIGRILMAAKDRKEEEYLKQLQLARQDQMGPLSAASMEMGSYHRGYECILRLHMLSELEEYFRVCHDFPMRLEDSSESSGHCSLEGLLKQWDARLQMAQSSFRTQEPILTLRRTLLSLGHGSTDSTLDTTVGKWWLWSAKVARKAGYLQTAYGCLLQAGAYNLPEMFVEKAKWLWEKREHDSALACLDKGISQYFVSQKQQQQQARNQVYAQGLLLYGKYSEEASSMETNAIVKQYKDVIEACPEWEDGHFHLAQYYDRIMTIMTDKEKPEKQGTFIPTIVKCFGQTLLYGNQYIYQAMPRMLSLWLDYGTFMFDSEQKEKTSKTHSRRQDGESSAIDEQRPSKVQLQKLQTQRAILSSINKSIQQLIEQLAPYQFFTAFPQLISRICHAQPDVANILQMLITKLLTCFPQQAIWMMMAVSKSSYAVRSRRCQDIFAAAKQLNPSLDKLILDATKLTERLIELCDREFKNPCTLSLSQHFKPLKRLLEDSSFSEIMLPLQSAMTVALPSTPGSCPDYNPFPGRAVYIKGFEDTIEILASLAKPKKITMLGSDGNLYVMMCKPKDDLRKDCRLMEFNAIVNKFLRKDAESRRRQLHIRTYTVTPLNETCGLIEWVSNTQGFRNILHKLYKETGNIITAKELKACMPSLNSKLEVKLQIYKQKLLPQHPPIFKEWFLRTFPDPTSWYNARVAYARTNAVMCMIGYVLGLGDRHGENILLDSTNGDLLHVDFNCLFNKGETFEWPERVPFRLTHNMVSALGPMGCEGIFRRACEVTLRVVRAQTDPLMSILKPFIYDPLVEWTKPVQRSSAKETGEITNEQGLNHVQNIEERLKGILKTQTRSRGLPLSIEGHVKYLIQEATDEKNLCQMYIGWTAYF